MKDSEQGAFACASESGYQQGLTKREYFAAMAMQGMLAKSCEYYADIDKQKKWAELECAYAVRYADALLSELEKPTT